MRGVDISILRRFDAEPGLQWLVCACAMIFPITVLTVNRADSLVLFLLGIIGVYAIFRWGVRDIGLNKQEILLIWVFLGWYAAIVLCYLIGDKTDTGFKLLGRNLRLIFFVPAFIACRRYLTKPRLLFIGLVLAPFVILSVALWQFMHAKGYVRAGGVVEIIPFGDFSMAMAFMAIAWLQFTAGSRAIWRFLVAGAALSAGMIASVLSETRGGWLAMPVLLFVTAIILSRRSGKRGIKVFLMCMVFAVLAFLLVPRTIILDRTDGAVQNIENYVDYMKLINMDHAGCMDRKLFSEALAREIVKYNYSKSISVSVVKDDDGLARSGLSKFCEHGNMIKLTNLDTGNRVTVFVKRSSVIPDGLQKIRFVIRGSGKISISRRGKRHWDKFDNEQYSIVDYAQEVKEPAWAYFWVPANGTIYFAPVQNTPGEYVFPFANGSAGQRLEMWRAAWHIFKQHPLFGAGTGSFMAEVGKLARTGDISPSVIGYDHPHNDYLNALSSQGLLGLISYLLVMGYPFLLFYRALWSDDDKVRSAGFCGVVMIAGLLIFGLTETMFTHSIVMSWYVTFSAMLMAIIFRKKDIEIK
ncbi:MAG TPA: O-antigen ligase family protein [Gammaproteobacteria bacterium]|nr:O-antigen ligase family protein [Gammaproteobacteria bacterium]